MVIVWPHQTMNCPVPCVECNVLISLLMDVCVSCSDSYHILLCSCSLAHIHTYTLTLPLSYVHPLLPPPPPSPLTHSHRQTREQEKQRRRHMTKSVRNTWPLSSKYLVALEQWRYAKPNRVKLSYPPFLSSLTPDLRLVRELDSIPCKLYLGWWLVVMCWLSVFVGFRV